MELSGRTRLALAFLVSILALYFLQVHMDLQVAPLSFQMVIRKLNHAATYQTLFQVDNSSTTPGEANYSSAAALVSLSLPVGTSRTILPSATPTTPLARSTSHPPRPNSTSHPRLASSLLSSLTAATPTSRRLNPVTSPPRSSASVIHTVCEQEVFSGHHTCSANHPWSAERDENMDETGSLHLNHILESAYI